MVKLKRSPKNVELDVSEAQNWAIPHFSTASSKFRGKRRIPRRSMKICMRGILLVLMILSLNSNLSTTRKFRLSYL